MTRRAFANLLSLRRLAGVSLFLTVLTGLTGCFSLSGLYSVDKETGVTRYDPGGGADGNGGTAPKPSDDNKRPGQPQSEASSLLSGDGISPGDERLLRVTEEYWLQTPWFGVSSIIVMVKRLPGPSVIVVPAGSLLEETMHPLSVVTEIPTDHRRSRIKVSVSFHLGDVPPFVKVDRFVNPDFY